MKSLEQLRRQLGTVDELGEIVRTMKALAAVSIRQYERAVESLAEYARTIELGLQVALREVPAAERIAERRTEIGSIVLGSDHGLCGRFNEDIAEHAAARLSRLAPHAAAAVIAVGTRVADALESWGHAPGATLPVPASAARITATVRELLLSIDEWRTRGIARIYLFHNRPQTGGRRTANGIRLMPPHLERLRADRPWQSSSLPIFTIDRERLLAALLRQYFFITLFRACAESLAAENASRLAAMQAAEKNLDDRRNAMQGEFRRHRQEAITDELLDVVAGYEVLRELS